MGVHSDLNGSSINVHLRWSQSLVVLLEDKFFFFKDFICLFFRERRREGEREGEKHQCVVASCAPPTGDLASNTGMCPDWELNQRAFVSQAGAQSTEPHQPGPTKHF